MQKMMKGVKSVRCLQGAGVTIGKWVVGIPHEQPIGDGAPRYSAECIWRVSTYTTCRIHTHTHRYMRHTNTHTKNCPYVQEICDVAPRFKMYADAV